MKQQLKQALLDNQLSFTEEQQDKLLAFLALLQKWNHVFNLTAITEPLDMIYLHLIDSLLIYPYLQGQRLLDVGSGAGLPGIPLAIVSPQHHWTLLDKNSKKTRFLTQVIAELSLPHINIVKSDIQDFHPAVGFDTILTRAFGTLAFFIEKVEHLLTPNGSLLAMKGKYPQEELDALPKNIVAKEIIPLTMKGREVTRHLVHLRRRGI